MSYCTSTYVQIYVKRVQFSESTKITPQDVENYSENISRQMDAQLSTKGLTVPVNVVSSPLSYALLQDICALGSAALTERIASYTGSARSPSEHADILFEQYKLRMQELLDDPSMLSDALYSQTLVTGLLVRSPQREGELLVDRSETQAVYFKSETIDEFVERHGFAHRNKELYPNTIYYENES